MKKYIVLAVALMMVSGVQAAGKGKGKAKGSITLEKYTAMQQKRAEAKGKTFSQKKCEAMFAKKDLNKDGVLTKDEIAAGKKGGNGKKGKKGSKK